MKSSPFGLAAPACPGLWASLHAALGCCPRNYRPPPDIFPRHPFHHGLNWGALSSKKPSPEPGWVGSPASPTACPSPQHAFAHIGCGPRRVPWVRLWEGGTFTLCRSHSARPTCAQAPPLPLPQGPGPRHPGRNDLGRRTPASANTPLRTTC